MQIPIPLFLGTHSAGSSKASTSDGDIVEVSESHIFANGAKRDTAHLQLNTAEYDENERPHYTPTYRIDAKGNGTATWIHNGVSEELPEAIAREAYEAGRNLAGHRLTPEQADVLADFVASPLKVKIDKDAHRLP